MDFVPDESAVNTELIEVSQVSSSMMGTTYLRVHYRLVNLIE